MKRWPYVTELFLKKYKKDDTAPIKQYSAIELYNPHGAPVSLLGYSLLVDGVAVPMTNWPSSFPAQQRIVIRSDAASIPVDPLDHTKPDPPPVVTIIVEAQGLDLSKSVKLIRTRGAGGAGAADVIVASAHVELADPAPTAAAFQTQQWDDAAANARWTLPVWMTRADAAHDYTSNNEGGTGNHVNNAGIGTDTNLGQPNSTDAGFALPNSAVVQPCPAFVRCGPFINVGEVMRLFYVGPTYNAANLNASKSLSDSLAVSADPVANLYVGRLPWDGAVPATGYVDGNNVRIPTIPMVPIGCLVGDYLMVNSPLANGVDNNGDGIIAGPGDEVTYGKINANTAPQAVLQCLPGLLTSTWVTYANLTNPVPILNDLVAYRDSAKYLGTADFTTRKLVPGYAGLGALRIEGTNGIQGPGFATIGELALVMQRKALPMPPPTVTSARATRTPWPWRARSTAPRSAPTTGSP